MNECKLNKLSVSALGMYLTCGEKYRKHYIERKRPKVTSGALLFGGAIDKAINNLLESKSLDSATKVFDKEWNYGWINNKQVSLPDSTQIVYAKKDFDKDLSLLKDFIEYEKLMELKEEKGFENFTEDQKKFYNAVNWECLKAKGYLMLQAYEKEVLPNIKKVLAVQKEFNLKGKNGFTIPGWIDLIVEWKDGKRYVLDNKTSAIEYEKDSASKSKQLIAYYYAENKERSPKEKLDGVGFIVMSKQIQKNRIKVCEKCAYNGTGGRAKTCDQTITTIQPITEKSLNVKNERCNGIWKETINPECKIDIILNEVTLPAQNLIVKSFQGATKGIEAGVFPPNPDACMNYGVKCQFFKSCWENKEDDLVTLPEKEGK